MTARVHALFFTFEFPAGVSPGEGSDDNTLAIARRGDGRPVLRGTSLAGVLRATFRRQILESQWCEEAEQIVDRYFGFVPSTTSDAHGQRSAVLVSDCPLEIGAPGNVVTRTHHLRNRHTGSVAEGGLFTLEACPPGTTARAAVWLHEGSQEVPDRDKPSQNMPGSGPQPDEGKSPPIGPPAEAFLEGIARELLRGIMLGGKSARGVGRALVQQRRIIRRTYDLTSLDGYSEWLDDDRGWRTDARFPEGASFVVADAEAGKRLTVRLRLGIPRGQDVLVGAGEGLDHAIEPMRVTRADGTLAWCLPGGSLRGIFRGWMAGLAASDYRAGKLPEGVGPVADSVDLHDQRMEFTRRGEKVPPELDFNGDNFGRCFAPRGNQDTAAPGPLPSCPIARLFGSLFQSGRIFISDAYAPVSSSDAGGSPTDGSPAEEQLRQHVAVDRVSGGAAEGLLFDNTVLTARGGGTAPEFEVDLQIDDPHDYEVDWLVKTIQALDRGILRVGSSKASGRLSLTVSPEAAGFQAEKLTELKPVYGPQRWISSGD